MTDLKKFQKEFSDELTDNILNYWVRKVYDPVGRTFTGMVDHNGKPDHDAPLGIVFISRILWTFSSAYSIYPTAIYRRLAEEAYRIMTDFFLDRENGGVFWEVSKEGLPLNDTKQIYGQAFAIYGLAEYARIFGEGKAADYAKGIFDKVEKNAFDPVHGGYFEAFTRSWDNTAGDFITPQAEEMKKSMNTHLHLLEAYTNLYRANADGIIKKRILHLLDLFIRHIINPENFHFQLFFDAGWKSRTATVSFGHDIEGSWLLHEAAETIGDHDVSKMIRPLAMKMAYAVGNEALDKKGGIYNEFEDGRWDRDFHWWPQAEAVVGFYNAYQMTGDEKFFNIVRNTWKFIRKYQIDHVNGEWFWLVTPDYKTKPMPKVSPWKCPYHNGRMCMEMIRRLENSGKTNGSYNPVVPAKT
jgi:mannobiose 2-epimerase